MALSPTPIADDEPVERLSNAWLDGLLGYQVGSARKAIFRAFGVKFAKMDLTMQQFAVLHLVKLHPGAPQVALANQLDTDRATMMAVIDRLEARGLMTRERSKTDRRRQELKLTPKGETTVEEAKALILEHEKGFTSRFTPQELDALFEYLRRIQEP